MSKLTSLNSSERSNFQYLYNYIKLIKLVQVEFKETKAQNVRNITWCGKVVDESLRDLTGFLANVIFSLGPTIFDTMKVVLQKLL